MNEIKEILNKIGYINLKESATQFSTRPLYRESDNDTALTINKQTGQFYDFVTRIGGDLSQLIKLTLNLHSNQEVKEFLISQSHAPINLVPKDSTEIKENKKYDKALLNKLVKNNSYWNNRGISDETLSKFHGGIAINGRMIYRYVFPIFNEKEDLIGFSGRSLTNNPNFPKWKLIGTKSNWCYPINVNINILSETKECILVESIGDMLSLWENGIYNVVVLFGLVVSPKVLEFLLKLDIQKIVIALNNDIDNNFAGNNASKNAQICLEKFFDKSQIHIHLPLAKDFGEMSKEEINLWKNKKNLL